MENRKTKSTSKRQKINKDKILTTDKDSNQILTTPKTATLSLSASSVNSYIDNLATVKNPSLRKVNMYGFEINKTNAPNQTVDRTIKKTEQSKSKEEKESKRLVKWIQMTKNWGKYRKHKNYIKKRIRKGIPESLRGDIWYSIIGADKSKKSNPDKFKQLLASKHLPAEVENQIKKDLKRTFPCNFYFKEETGQNSLYNVLKCVALEVEDVGYCQGMGFIVASLLLYMGEEDAFWVMIVLMNGKYNLREMFKLGLPLTRERLDIFSELTKYFYPKLYNHLDEEGFPINTFANNWFMTVFCSSIPFSISVRVLDIFMSEGFKAMYRVSLAIMYLTKNDLMAVGHDEFLGVMKKKMFELGDDPDLLLKTAFKISLTSHKIKQLSRRFRAENGLLGQ